MSWNKLSMSDRAKYIKLAVQNGITDLSQIRDTYNSYADGGYTKDISEIAGPVRLRDTQGNVQTFDSGIAAMEAMGNGYRYTPFSNVASINNNELYAANSLPEVEVVGQVPKEQLYTKIEDRPEIHDPVRDAIFNGIYGTTKFEPTDANISRYLKIYDTDKKVGEGYGSKAWGKLGLINLAGATTAGLGALTAPFIGSALTSPVGQTLIGEAAGGMALHTGANELYKGITGSSQGYMADAADWIADKYEGSMLQDILNKGGIYLPGDRKDFKTVMEYSDPAAFTSRPLTMGYNALARGVNRVYNSVAPKLQGMQKYYHGTNGEFYDPRNAFTGTSYDIGLHASIDPKIANAMTGTTGDPHVLSFYGPKPKTTTIDTGRNDLASQLTNSRLREVYPNIPESEYTYIGQLKKEADGLVKELSKSTLSKKERATIDQRLAEINSEGSRILSDYGYDVVGYNNINLNEGGGGASVFITDPTSIYKPKTLITPTNLRNSELYPFLSRRTPMGVKDIWGNNGERYSREAYTLDPSYMYDGYGINGNFNNLLFAPYKNSVDPISQLDRNKLKIGQEMNLKDFLTKEELQKISSFNKDISNRLVKAYSDEGYPITPEEQTVIEGNILNDMKVKIVDDGELDASAWVTDNTIYIPKRTLDDIATNKQKWTLDELLEHELEHAQRAKLLDILKAREDARAFLAENPFDVLTSDRMLARMAGRVQKPSKIPESINESIIGTGSSSTYTPEELEVLEDAYQFSDDYLVHHQIVPDLEKGATNRQIRYNISQAHGGVKHEELDKIIDEMSDEEILNQVLKSNGYGHDFYGKIMSDELNTPWKSSEEADAFIKNKANAIRKALKYVGVGAGVGLGVSASGNTSRTEKN